MGIIGANIWFADAYTNNLFLQGGQGATDYFRTYQTIGGVQGLPRFSWDDVSTQTSSGCFDDAIYAFVPGPNSGCNLWVNTSNNDMWFVPPLCQSSSTLCGVAYGYDCKYCVDDSREANRRGESNDSQTAQS